MKMERQKTCTELIGEQKQRRVARLQAALANEYNEPPGDNAVDFENIETYQDGVLEITRLPVRYRVLLSWGGPSDGFILELDDAGQEIERAFYFYQDWFDGAEVELFGDDLKAVCQMFGYLAEMDE